MFELLQAGVTSEITRDYLNRSTSIWFKVETVNERSVVKLLNQSGQRLTTSVIKEMSQLGDAQGVAIVFVKSQNSSFVLHRATLDKDQAFSLAVRMFLM